MTDSDTILALLRDSLGFEVYDGHVADSDHNEKTISAPTPYLVYFGVSRYPGLGDSLAGTSGALLKTFRIWGVGETRQQAEWAIDKARALLDRRFVEFGSGPRFVRVTEDTQDPTRDETWRRPGGAPLFSGRDDYDVAI